MIEMPNNLATALLNGFKINPLQMLANLPKYIFEIFTIENWIFSRILEANSHSKFKPKLGKNLGGWIALLNQMIRNALVLAPSPHLSIHRFAY